MNGTISVLALQKWADAFRRSALGVDDFLARVGVAPSADPETARVPLSHVAEVLEEIAVATATPHIGIELALALPPGVLGTMDYRWSASATLIEAMFRSVASFRKVTDAIQYELQCEGEESRILQRNREVPRVLMEHFFAMLVLRMRHVSDVRVELHAVRFACGAPHEGGGGSGSTTRLDEFFGTKVLFDASVTEIVFPTTLLQRKLLTADPALLQLLREHPQVSKSAPVAAATIDVATDPFLERVREVVTLSLDGLDGGDIVGKVAERLEMSTRSLQRKLSERKTSLSELVDDVRRSVAMKLLANPGLLLADLAVLLGFANVSTVFRAFHRWTGMSPREYQKQLEAKTNDTR